MPEKAEPKRELGNATPEFVVIGCILAAWGSEGAVKVEVMTHSLQRFAPGQRAYCQGKPISISKARRSGRHFILWLEGVQNRDEAEKLRGLMLEIPGKEVPSLPEGRYYHFQILEMEVWTTQGELLGNVKSIIQTGSNDVYVVMGKGREVLIPAVAGLIKSIDPEENRMVVEPWKGLL